MHQVIEKQLTVMLFIFSLVSDFMWCTSSKYFSTDLSKTLEINFCRTSANDHGQQTTKSNNTTSFAHPKLLRYFSWLLDFCYFYLLPIPSKKNLCTANNKNSSISSLEYFSVFLVKLEQVLI